MVTITLLGILHAIPDSDDPHAIVARLMAAVPSGSYLAISQLGSDLFGKERLENIKKAFGGKMQQQLTWRSREEVARFFESTDLVEPGLVRLEEWRPDSATNDGHKSPGWAAVARKR